MPSSRGLTSAPALIPKLAVKRNLLFNNLIFEILVYGLFILCLLDARQRGPAMVWQLLTGIVYGWLLEYATILQLQAYQYSRFMLMFGELPVAVGIGWGVIIYSVMLVSQASSLPEWAQPVLDGILALNIDLAMDAVAIRLGMWDWGLGFEQQYFGVPYTNFWAWFWVVFSFSMGLRVLRHALSQTARHWAPAGAIFIGLVGVTGMNTFVMGMVSSNGHLATILVTLGVALSLLLWLRPKFSPRPLPAPAFWVPVSFHAYFVAAGLLTGALLRTPFLLAVSLAMFFLALYWHRGSWLPAQRRENPTAAQDP